MTLPGSAAGDSCGFVSRTRERREQRSLTTFGGVDGTVIDTNAADDLCSRRSRVRLTKPQDLLYCPDSTPGILSSNKKPLTVNTNPSSARTADTMNAQRFPANIATDARTIASWNTTSAKSK